MRQTGTDGSASLFGFLTATFVFAVSFSAVIQVSVENGGEAEDTDYDDRAAEASSLADLILGDPGRGWYGADPPCVSGVLNSAAFAPESVTRFGIAQERCAAGASARERVTNISFDKMRNLRKAEFAKDAGDGAVDYLEARDSLGVTTAGLNFHLRSWPLLPDAASLLRQGQKDANLKPLYIGNYSSSGGGGGPPPYAQGVIDQADRAIVYVNVTNNGGSSTIFDAFFEIDLKDAEAAFTLHTKVLAAGQSGNMSFTLLKTADWQWKNANQKEIEIEVHDKDTKLIDTTIPMSGVTMTYGSNRVNVFAESEKLSSLLSGPSVQAKYYYEARDGKGKLVDFSDWTYRLFDGGGALVRTDVLPTGKEGSIVHAFAAVDGYSARLSNDALSEEWNRDVVNIVDGEPGPYGGASTYTPGPSVVPEMSYIDALIQNFDAHSYSTTYHHAGVTYAAVGDVYPDLRDSMNDDLQLVLKDSGGNPTLEKYSTLFVGSNVDHNAMTSQAAKATIRDWVYAGGTLIVFGSSDQSVNWLQPIFHASLDSASGGLATPDTTHPSLHTPNDLDYAAYKYDTEWSYNSGADAKFTHVVTSGSSGDVLGASNAGVFGNGRVILSSWRPYDLTNDQATTCALPLQTDSTCQAAFLMHNLMTVSYSDLYLDYGPPVPQSSPHGVQSRIAFVYHPEVKRIIEVQVMVYVFG